MARLRPPRKGPGGGAAPIACTSGSDVLVKGATRGRQVRVRENQQGNPVRVAALRPAWHGVRKHQQASPSGAVALRPAWHADLPPAEGAGAGLVPAGRWPQVHSGVARADGARHLRTSMTCLRWRRKNRSHAIPPGHVPAMGVRLPADSAQQNWTRPILNAASRKLPSGFADPTEFGDLSALRSPISPSSGCSVPEQKSHCCSRVDLQHYRRALAASPRRCTCCCWPAYMRENTRPALGRRSVLSIRRQRTT